MQNQSDRYYILLDGKSQYIVDSLTKNHVEGSEKLNFVEQKQLRSKLNKEDYANRRQYGEPRADFEKRTAPK